MLGILWRCKAGENKNWFQSFEWKIIYQFDSFHEEGDFVHVSSPTVLPSPPPRTSTPFPWLTDWMFSATGNNRPTPLSLILHSVRTVVHFAHQNSEDRKLNMFIIILFGRNWSTYLHREFTLQTSRCLCASSVWLSCHMHYWPFHIAMTLKTVSTRNTKLVKIAIEPIARAFATPWNVKQIQNQNSCKSTNLHMVHACMHQSAQTPSQWRRGTQRSWTGTSGEIGHIISKLNFLTVYLWSSPMMTPIMRTMVMKK